MEGMLYITIYSTFERRCLVPFYSTEGGIVLSTWLERGRSRKHLNLFYVQRFTQCFPLLRRRGDWLVCFPPILFSRLTIDTNAGSQIRANPAYHHKNSLSRCLSLVTGALILFTCTVKRHSSILRCHCWYVNLYLCVCVWLSHINYLVNPLISR